MGIPGQVHNSQGQGQALLQLYLCDQAFGCCWAWPDPHVCTGATLSAELGVGTGVTFGMAVGVETGTARLGSGVTGATECGVH